VPRGPGPPQQRTPEARSGRAPAIGTIPTRGYPGRFSRSMSGKPTAPAVSAPRRTSQSSRKRGHNQLQHSRPHDPTSKITIYGWSTGHVLGMRLSVRVGRLCYGSGPPMSLTPMTAMVVAVDQFASSDFLGHLTGMPEGRLKRRDNFVANSADLLLQTNA
jgi:hypothetical protein